MWIDLSSVLSQCTCLTDGQTDTFLIAGRAGIPCMQRGKNVLKHFINLERSTSLEVRLKQRNYTTFESEINKTSLLTGLL